MKATKYRELDVAELERQTQDAQEQLFRLRFQIGMGQTEGLKKYRGLKKGSRADAHCAEREGERRNGGPGGGSESHGRQKKLEKEAKKSK